MTTTTPPPGDPKAAGSVEDQLERARAEARAALARSEGDASAREREVQFQALVAELATAFIGLAGTELDAALGSALERIAKFAGAERAVLVRLATPGETLVVTHEWAGPGLSPGLRSLHGRRALAWSLHQLRLGRVLYVRERSELPPDAIHEAKAWDLFGIRSILALPVRTKDGELLGFTAFATLTKPASWRPEDLPLFDLAAEMLRSAYENQVLRERLERSELRLRKLLDAGAIGILAADNEGRIWEANDAALRVTGTQRADLEAGRLRWDQLTPPEYRPLTMTALDQLEQSGCSQPWEQDIYLPNGSRVSILVCSARIAETPDRFLIYAVDITADKKARRVLALHNRLARLVTLFSTRLIAVSPSRIGETIDDALREIGGVLGLDRSTVWIDVEGQEGRSRCMHVWDRKRRERSGADIPEVDRTLFPKWDAFFRERRPMVVHDLQQEFEPDSIERAFLEMHKSRSGVAVPLIGTATPIGFVTFSSQRLIDWADSTVTLLCVIGEIFAAAVMRGRTEEKQRRVHAELEARVAERTVQLESANRELEAFSYAVSHDLRAPLRSVDGFSRILVEDHADGLPADARAVLDRVRVTTRRMGELIDALLRLSRITRSEPRYEATDLSAIARDLAAVLAASAPERLVDFAIDDGLVVEGEPRLLSVLLDNLLGNAWKFTASRSHARIEVGSETTDDGTVFFVKDDGVGFEPSQAERMFMPFQRLHDPRDYEGHGVGLATVKRIVGLHGGRVWGSGEPGKGAIIRFTLGEHREDDD